LKRRTKQLAKLTRPRIHAPIARERLFQRIDELRARPVVWVSGPPGSGKTTLAVTYLQARRLPSIWYQVDGGDADPATFFFYLREAAPAVRGKSTNLPLLTADHLIDLCGFGRRFFRSLFARLPAGALIVFDNFQDIAAQSQLHDILAAAVDEVPPDANLLILSRTPPPPPFARAIASDKLASLSWSDLRLTLAEADALAAARVDVNSETLAMLFDSCSGWAAGGKKKINKNKKN
jgi:ATP/maltotriose-dependent transcriptional regulator MalT